MVIHTLTMVVSSLSPMIHCKTRLVLPEPTGLANNGLSYGTMTADGLRALLQCGLPKNHPRVVAAQAWLERNFSAIENPGTFNPDREVLRNATYYYWAWTVAHAFDRADIRVFEQQGKTIHWAEELAEELIQRQQSDGTWMNRYSDAREDDPLVTTPWAAAALAICRKVITTQ